MKIIFLLLIITSLIGEFGSSKCAIKEEYLFESTQFEMKIDLRLGEEFYVNILSIVDKEKLELGCNVLLRDISF